MDYLVLCHCHANEPSGDLKSSTWWELAMMHASKIESELTCKQHQNPSIPTLEEYANFMRIAATPNRCLYTNTPELLLIAKAYSLNIAVLQVDHCSPLHYVLIVDKQLSTCCLLLLNGFHCQHIITNDAHHKMDISVVMNHSYHNNVTDDHDHGHIPIKNPPTLPVFQDLDSVSALDAFQCLVCKENLN